MESATHSSPGNALAWRNLGIMSYCYAGDKEHSQYCLQRAYELCPEDYIALRMRGQVMLELGKPKEARTCLQAALELVPDDNIALASLALCVRAMGHRPPSGVHRLNYKMLLQSTVDMRSLINSTDCEELFATCTHFGFADEVRARAVRLAGREDEYAHAIQVAAERSRTIIKGAVEEIAVDAPPDSLYWCGMYWLQMGRPENLRKAEDLFKRATQRVDTPAHALSLYMLGWLAELRNDVRIAERFYCFALQLEPCEPLMFLKVAKLADDTSAYVKGLAKACSKRDRQRRKAERKKQKKLAAGKLVAKGADYGYSFPPNAPKNMNQEHDFAGGMAPPGMSTNGNESMDNLPKTSSMRERLLLHDRVTKLASLRRTQLATSLNGLHVPGKFVHLEPFWLEKALHAFAQCDDWSSLLKSTREFRAREIIGGKEN
jgi:tetratricopeptide (TPR) repeat protein